MDEKKLYFISIVVTILGLAFLYFYAEEIDLEVKELDAVKPNEIIKLKGVLTQVTTKDKVIFLQLQGEKMITSDVILFTSEDTFLKPGDYIEVEGRVEEYQGKKEVIANSIILK